METPTRTILGTILSASGVMGIALTFIMWGVNLNRGIHAPGNLSIAFGVGLVLGFAIGAGFWIHRAISQETEYYIEDEDETPSITVIQDADTDYPHGTFGLPEGITIEHMIELARQIVTLKSDFSHSALSGPGRPFSRSEYEAMRKYCELRKWIAWNNPKYKSKGLAVRKLGIDAFKQLLTPYPTNVFRLYGYDRSREGVHAHTDTQGARQWES